MVADYFTWNTSPTRVYFKLPAVSGLKGVIQTKCKISLFLHKPFVTGGCRFYFLNKLNIFFIVFLLFNLIKFKIISFEVLVINSFHIGELKKQIIMHMNLENFKIQSQKELSVILSCVVSYLKTMIFMVVMLWNIL